jgi:E3 ubiquitin-protein ligase UHRF1
MAGIAGDPDTGAWSVVVSNAGYGGIDKDEGDVITYSAPGAFDTKAKKADTEGRGAKCLLASFATKKPVRVLRGQTPWKSAPFSGYRYDGLYTVEEKGEGTNKAGGVYIWVKLVRVSNQEPIQKKVPKKQQRDQEEKVSDGY